jgi:hypothetical protein
MALKAGRPERAAKTVDDIKANLEEPIVRLNVNMKKSVYRRIKQQALDEDITVSELIHRAVFEYMKKGVNE